MPLLVQKYGGTSVGSPERIKAVAARIARARAAGNDLVVVVSAMGHTTDQFIELARQVHPSPPRRELDMLLTAGERISMSLLAMALGLERIEAISFTGSQSGILTDTRHGGARILEVRGDRIREELARGRVVIVAGFQGVSREREITTLGRGGSDATAVAIAGALGAATCEIYTDVPGVMTADPRLVPSARLIPHLDFETAFTLTSLGAGVLMPRAADIARRLRVATRVRSSFEEHEGTLIDAAAPGTGSVVAVAVSPDIAIDEIEAPGVAPPTTSGDAAIEPEARLDEVLARRDAGPGRTYLARPAGADPGTAARHARGDLVSVVTAGAPQEAFRAVLREAAAAPSGAFDFEFEGPASLSRLLPAGAGASAALRLHRALLE